MRLLEHLSSHSVYVQAKFYVQPSLRNTHEALMHGITMEFSIMTLNSGVPEEAQNDQEKDIT